MNVSGVRSPIDIAVSGLKAESVRLNVIANNIANSNTSHTSTGEPYRRQEVVLSTQKGLTGVTVDQIAPDMATDFKKVYEPGHPDAKDGYLTMPNVELPVEMMNMVAASRAYQANTATLKRYQEVMDTAIELLK